MFSVGDKVVYPMHGAGIVQAIEQHELAGEAVDYLVMVMLLTDMRVMVPLKNVERVGLRHIISKDEIPGIEKVLGTPVEFNAKGITWNRRFNMYLDKMKSGNVLDVAEVIHILQTQESEKKLSTGERRLLGNARQILVSEMMLVCDESQKDAEKWLDKFFE